MEATATKPECKVGSDPEPGPSTWRRRGLVALRTLGFLAALYGFLLAVTLIGDGFKLFGESFSRALIESTSNPFIGLFVGVLATSLVQSSSCTTSMVVGMVASGTLTVTNAVPIVMGANIGTTITNTLVSIGHVTREDEFRRAMAGATVHDFFNLLTVAILLPVEILTGFLERSATLLSGLLWGTQGAKIHSPLKAILKPVAKPVVRLFEVWLPPGSGQADAPEIAAGVVVSLVGLALLFGCLVVMTRVMRRALAGRVEKILDRTIGRAPLLGLVVGLVITAVVQSSSVTTSILVPLAAAGILTTEQVFPITLGANVGTTVTAILASLAGTPAGLTIALAHLLFNITGIAIVYPFGPLRRVPIRCANWLAQIAAESKRYAFAYVVGVFFVVPGLFVFVWWRLL
jgi:sodium-dependent phosphate cotransporter